jgi:serine O-acetyltransferase
LFGRLHVVFKFLLSPVLFLVRPWTGAADIHYRAEIGKGLKILHPALGVVVSGMTITGRNLVLTGGNCIGGRRALRRGDVTLGDNVELGANAVILGPVRLGNNGRVGAGAVVTRDCGDDQVLVGIPALSRARVGDVDLPASVEENSCCQAEARKSPSPRT